MKPNTIELDDKGIFCYDAPEKSHYVVDDDGLERYQQALEQAKRDRVYFKPDDEVSIISAFVTSALPMPVISKPYPVPDEYVVIIGCDNDCRVDVGECCHPSNCNNKYAILAPKEAPEYPHNVEYGSKKQQSIEEVSRELNPYGVRHRGLEHEAFENGFIAGANWMQEQFKQEKQ